MNKLNLAPRERNIVLVGAAALAVLLLLYAVVLPFQENKSRLERGITNRQAGIAEMMRLQAQYHELRRNSSGIAQRLQARPAGFTLFSFLESTAGETGVKGQIMYMRPTAAADTGRQYRESVVEMKLEGMALKPLLDFLRQIEMPEQLVMIRRIAVQPNGRSENLLDIIVQVTALEI